MNDNRRLAQYDRAEEIIRTADRPVSFGYICTQLNEPIFKDLEAALKLRVGNYVYREKVYFRA